MTFAAGLDVKPNNNQGISGCHIQPECLNQSTWAHLFKPSILGSFDPHIFPLGASGSPPLGPLKTAMAQDVLIDLHGLPVEVSKIAVQVGGKTLFGAGEMYDLSSNYSV